MSVWSSCRIEVRAGEALEFEDDDCDVRLEAGKLTLTYFDSEGPLVFIGLEQEARARGRLLRPDLPQPPPPRHPPPQRRHTNRYLARERRNRRLDYHPTSVVSARPSGCRNPCRRRPGTTRPDAEAR